MATKGQKFLDYYTKTWPFIKRSSSGENYVRCDTCNTDSTIKHGGKFDIMRHIKTSKHVKKSEIIQGISKIETFVDNSPSDRQSVTEAECLMANFIIEHNLPVSVVLEKHFVYFF